MTDLLALTSRYSALASRLRRTNGEIALSTYQLSSGNRIGSAAQDVASISTIARLQSGISSARTAATGVAQANALLQIADGGLAQIYGMLERAQALALRGANAALSNQDRGYLDIELAQLMQEIDRTAKSTKFSSTQVIYAPSGSHIVGTANDDVLIGGAGADTIDALEGNDLIYAGAGDDVIRAVGNVVPGLRGSVYLSPAGITNFAGVNAYIAANPPSATFTATSLDYPNGPTNSGGTTVGNFLGVDAASLSNAGIATAPAERMIFVFEGTINVPADGTYSFNVGSDDGFNLQIDGATVSQYTTNRSFAFTNLNLPLSAGEHSFRLTYWENTGGQGLLVNSNMFASNIVDSTATEFVPPSDGNDTIYGGDGYDTVELRGRRQDYTITDMGDGSVIVADTRLGSNDGSDRLYSIERLRFGDGEELELDYGSQRYSADASPTTLRFNVADASGKTFDYAVVNASTEGLFDDAASVNLRSVEAAEKAISAIGTAVNRLTAMRAYVGSKQSQAGYIENALHDRFANTDNARAVLQDTDITQVTTEYAMQLARHEAGVSVAAQAQTLNFDAISTIMDALGEEV